MHTDNLTAAQIAEASANTARAKRELAERFIALAMVARTEVEPDWQAFAANLRLAAEFATEANQW